VIEALDIQVRGVVQGVGFRPFVYRLAKRHLIAGWVLNAADGVSIHAEGEARLLDEFVLALSEDPPAASQIDEIEMKEVPLEGFEAFEIRFSQEGAVEKTTLISPDLATCDDCVRELFDEGDRRFRYPFINCTNCGPRFTIIESLPYDRGSTSMGGFTMCPQCQGAYDDPLDRRFHAQPNACFKCGPHISWKEAAPGGGEDTLRWGRTREESDAILARAVEMLHAGKILAVKGLGGFHLACDAANPEALRELRARKRRAGQAFAVMVPDLATLRRCCLVNEAEEKLLAEPARPIVLLRKRPGATFALGLADGLTELGAMLPSTPIQHLLLRGFGGMLVMTSGNIHDEPIVTDDQEAHRRLSRVADAFLGHDRAILARYDDSVVRVLDAGGSTYALQFIRRARGYAPMPLALPAQDTQATQATQDTQCTQDTQATQDTQGDTFAAGPEQKNTFCMTRGTEAFVSQHIGDMENAEAFDAWLAAKKCYERLFGIVPRRLAADLHPEYLTTKWALEQERPLDQHELLDKVGPPGKEKPAGLPVTAVQHHHAHIVSVMAEHGLDAPVTGIALDGTGYGIDGAIWGGEVLICNYRAFERFANFAYVPMPGGAAAIKRPLRMAYGVLWAFDLLEHEAAQGVLESLGTEAALVAQMIEKGLNTPVTSSVGRIFDAASAMLGICVEPRYEGEGAVLLEAAIGQAAGDEAYPVDLVKNTATAKSTAQDTSVVLLDAAPLFRALLDDRVAGRPVSEIALRFHNGIAAALVDIGSMARMAYGIETVALSGGVFMNRYLTERCLRLMPPEGLTVAINRELPPNDGCISYGQACIAQAEQQE
jgi:hydrogenase maturation protein HypF